MNRLYDNCYFIIFPQCWQIYFCMICLSAATITSAVFSAKGDEDTNGITIPITYPDRRSKKAQVAIPSEENVIRAKEWVDYNIK